MVIQQDDQAPATQRDIRLLQRDIAFLRSNMVTKKDIAEMVTRKDIVDMATKQDFAYLMEQLGGLYLANERWKDEMMETMEKWKKEIIHEFKVFAEDMMHDFKGAFSDKLQQHEDRLVRLEQREGVAL
ncbi:MAG: hypothetical protein Greene041619_500 [Candidatus Peregrinibacteria bacterium Greene0416_19]|nr:MAG: hypothetical protein Greene041619_500 [Candidatus Peregrinibacteria bacterium Greene0416_19]